jgi:hypothetical protein
MAVAKRHGSRRATLVPLPSMLAPPEIRLANRSAMKGEWADPSDDKPTATRSARTITGWRRFDPLRKCLKRHGSASSISVEPAARHGRRRGDRILGAPAAPNAAAAAGQTRRGLVWRLVRQTLDAAPTTPIAYIKLDDRFECLNE